MLIFERMRVRRNQNIDVQPAQHFSIIYGIPVYVVKILWFPIWFKDAKLFKLQIDSAACFPIRWRFFGPQL